MMEMAQKILDTYSYYFDGSPDERLHGYPLTRTPITVIAILIVYYHFIKYSGPKFMQKRKPYDIKNFMIFYNSLQCIINVWASIQGFKLMFHPEFNLRCSPVNFELTPFNMKITALSYIYFIIKVVDLMDTVFMVLRKNYHQVSFLHVYHHIGMVLGTWMVLKFLPGAQLVWVGFLNCIVHSIMYFYYLLTAYDNQLKKSIWWKKHITELQMAQFFLILVHHTATLFNTNCSYPKSALLIFISQNFLMFYLFTKFYIDNYIKTKKNK